MSQLPDLTHERGHFSQLTRLLSEFNSSQFSGKYMQYEPCRWFENVVVSDIGSSIASIFSVIALIVLAENALEATLSNALVH